jgi:hypothetical protein
MIRIRQLVGFTLAAATVLGTLTACTDGEPGNAAGSGAQQAAAETAEKDAAAAARRRAGREPGSIRLGDLNKPKTAAEVGAPYDVCSLAWTDVPAEVRPMDGKPHTPTLDAPTKDDPFLVRCRYDNSGKTAINGHGATDGYFILGVAWGDQVETDPAKISGATAKSWSGKAGLIQRLPDMPHKGKSCIGSVKLSKGAALVDVTNGRFPNIDPCTVVDVALTVVAGKAS